MLKTARFNSDSRTHDGTPHGRVLELIVSGGVSHELPEAAALMRSIGADMSDEVQRRQAKVVVLNLREFEHSFGNEIIGILLPPYMALAALGGGKIAVVAEGETAAGLSSLLSAGHLEPLFGAVHPDLQSALADLTEVAGRKPEVPLPPVVTTPSPGRTGVSLPVGLAISLRGIFMHTKREGPLATVLGLTAFRASDETHDQLFHDSFYPHEGRKCMAVNLTGMLAVLGAIGLLAWLSLRGF